MDSKVAVMRDILGDTSARATAIIMSKRLNKIVLLVPSPREFSGFGLGFGLGGVAGDEETSAVVVFAV